MVSPPIDAMAEVQSAFRHLTKNWMLGVPLLLGYIIAACIFIGALLLGGGAALLTGGLTGGDPRAIMASLSGMGLLAGIAGIVAALVIAIATAAVYNGAESIWQGRSLNLGTDIGAGLSKLPQLVVAFLVLLIPIIICVLLAAVIIGIPLLIVLGFLMMFVVPAIVVGGASGVAAVGESWRLTTKNFGPSVMAFLAVVVVSIIGSIINVILGHIPILGQIVALVVSVAVGMFSALIVVRFYDIIRGAASVPKPT